MTKLQARYAVSVSTLALVVALTGVGAQAAGVFVTSKQIKNGTILTQDIHKGAVKSSDITNGTVSSADIGNGDVEPQDVTMPAPEQLQEAPGDVATGEFDTNFAPIDIVGTYAKEDPTSILQVDWSGSAAGGFTTCVFQLRVDGQPSPGNAGVTFAHDPSNVAVSALFEGLAPGPHQIEVWARATLTSNVKYSCTVGPASAGIPQTFVVSEQVI